MTFFTQKNIYPNPGQMRKNGDEKNSEYGHFLRSVTFQAWHDLERIWVVKPLQLQFQLL